jgi:hypothetical protein
MRTVSVDDLKEMGYCVGPIVCLPTPDLLDDLPQGNIVWTDCRGDVVEAFAAGAIWAYRTGWKPDPPNFSVELSEAAREHSTAAIKNMPTAKPE